MADAENLDRFAASLDLPRHRELFDYWRSKMPQGAESGRLPSRKQIDPVEIPKLLPWFSLIEVDWSQGAPRFRFRSAGTGVAERFGRNVTGRKFEDIYSGDFLKRQTATFAKVATSGMPIRTEMLAPIAKKEFLVCQRLLLPLASDGHRVDQVISLIVFDDKPGQPGGGMS